MRAPRRRQRGPPRSPRSFTASFTSKPETMRRPALCGQPLLEPSFSFENPWKLSQDLLVPWPELKAWIPRRIGEMRGMLRAEEPLLG